MPAERIIITELSGSQREIQLGGRALPYRGVSWGLEMRTKLTWYPGNPRATQQVLGPQYEPTILNGGWKDRFLVNGISVVQATGFPDLEQSPWSADALVAAMYSIVKAGNALRVSWRAEVRTGVMKRFTPRYGIPTGTDVEWEMEFEWQAADEAPSTAAESPADPSGALREEMNGQDAAASARPTGVNNATRAQVAGTLRNARTFAAQMYDAFRAISLSPTAVTAPVGALLSVTELMRVELDAERSRIESVPRQVVTESDLVAELLNVEAWRRTLAFEQEVLRNGSMARAARAASALAPGTLTVITVPGETTLRRLALTYYGSSDDWEIIANANGFTDSVIAAGTVVVIPPARAQ